MNLDVQAVPTIHWMKKLALLVMLDVPLVIQRVNVSKNVNLLALIVLGIQELAWLVKTVLI
jgi:hypothetical protein